MKDSANRRAEIVKRLYSLNLSKKKELQDVVELAALFCKTAVVLITLQDDEKQHLEFKVGLLELKETEVSLDHSFCAHTIS